MNKQEIRNEIKKAEAAYDKLEKAHGDLKTSTPEMDALVEIQDALYERLAKLQAN